MNILSVGLFPFGKPPLDLSSPQKASFANTIWSLLNTQYSCLRWRTGKTPLAYYMPCNTGIIHKEPGHVWCNNQAIPHTPASSPQILMSNRSGSPWKPSGNFCGNYIISSATYTLSDKSWIRVSEWHDPQDIACRLWKFRKCPRLIFGDILTKIVQQQSFPGP